MRKNKIEGAIKGAGRPAKERILLNVSVSQEAKGITQKVDRYYRGKFVSEAIVKIDSIKELLHKIQSKSTNVSALSNREIRYMITEFLNK